MVAEALRLLVVSLAVFGVSWFFSMFGKGGGEFYVPLLSVVGGLPLYTAAGTTLFVLVAQGASMLLVYHYKLGLVDWVLAAVAGASAMAGAFIGGYFSGSLPARVLAAVFVSLLLVSAVLLLRGMGLGARRVPGPRLRRRVGGYEYELAAAAVAAPVAVVAALASMAGISGGSLIIPLVVLIGGVPLRVAVGTNPVLVLLSATAGWLGHMARGGFSPVYGAAAAVAAIAGSQLGARMHARLSDEAIRVIFASLMLLAALVMALKALA